MESNSITFTLIDNDINGNPRYVCHFMNLLKPSEKYKGNVSESYGIAVKRANKIGGRRYHTKQYGGGIVFQSYNIHDTERQILELVFE